MEAREKFASISPAEFFKKNPELVGFANPARAIYQTLKELVENSLDATDVHGILPTIKIVIDLIDKEKQIYKINIEDNGIGIPPHIIPLAFGKVLYSSKYVLRQTRGMYGLGVKAAVLYSQMYQERPIEVVSSPIGSKRIYAVKLKIDIAKNEPIIYEKYSTTNLNGWHGTSVTIYIYGDWPRAKQKVYDYIKRTYLIAPYSEFIFKDPEGNVIYYPRVTDKLPKPPKEVKPHPYGVDVELIKTLIQRQTDGIRVREFLIKEFQSIGEATADKLLDISKVDPNRDVKTLTDEEIVRLSEVMKKFEDFRPPSADALSVIGEELIEIGLKKVFNPEFVVGVTRKPKAFQGHPFIVEVGLAYGGSIPLSEEPIILRYANKVPLIYDEKSDVIWKVISEIDWKRYGIEEETKPLVVMVHLCSTKIPFKSAGKESIAEVEEIEREIKNGIMQAGRKLKEYLHEKKKEEEIKKKLITYLKYVPEVSRSFAVILNNGIKDDKLGQLEEEIKIKLFELISKKLELKEIELYKNYKFEVS
jgi:DNA topoisomerase-6 subunit B